jgi:hypothetical protein
MTGIDLSKFQTIRMSPEDLVPAVNPRKVLNHGTLLPAIVAEKGQVLEPIIAWRPSDNDPILKRVKLDKGQAIPLRGHRRRQCCIEIRSNPDRYPHEIYENAATVPVIVIEGITEEKARNLALDDQDKEPLMTFEVFLEVFRRFEADHSYQKVAAEMTHGLYRALLRQAGEAKYKQMLAIDDGKDRIKKAQSDLRNGLDQWLFSAHILGLKDQVIAWTKKNRDGVKLGEDERLLFDAKPQNLTKLRSVYTNSKDEGWEPIRKLDIDEHGYPVIEGGNAKVREELSKMMDVFRNPENAETEKPTLPKGTERDNVKASARSDVGKLFAQFFCGEDSEGRAAADDRAYYMEAKAKALAEIYNTLHESLREVASVQLDELDINKYKAAWVALSEVLKASDKEQEAKKAKKPAGK